MTCAPPTKRHWPIGTRITGLRLPAGTFIVHVAFAERMGARGGGANCDLVVLERGALRASCTPTAHKGGCEPPDRKHQHSDAVEEERNILRPRVSWRRHDGTRCKRIGKRHTLCYPAAGDRRPRPLMGKGKSRRRRCSSSRIRPPESSWSKSCMRCRHAGHAGMGHVWWRSKGARAHRRSRAHT